MSIVAYRAVWTRSRARGALHHMLLAFAEHADENGVCWPSASTVARLARCNLRNAKKTIATLVAAGELVPVGRKTRSVVVYRIAACALTSVENDTGAGIPTSVENDTGAELDQCRYRHPTSVENDTGSSVDIDTQTVTKPSLNRRNAAAACKSAWNS